MGWTQNYRLRRSFDILPIRGVKRGIRELYGIFAAGPGRMKPPLRKMLLTGYSALSDKPRPQMDEALFIGMKKAL